MLDLVGSRQGQPWIDSLPLQSDKIRQAIRHLTGEIQLEHLVEELSKEDGLVYDYLVTWQARSPGAATGGGSIIDKGFVHSWYIDQFCAA